MIKPLKHYASLVFAGGTIMVLIGIIATLSILGVFQLRRIHEEMENVVAMHERKVDIVTRTQIAAHMHADRLARMALVRDPFAQDALWMEFLHAGYMVGFGRDQLKSMGFTEREKANFDAQSELIKQIEPAQDEVVTLLKSEDYPQADAYLINHVIPLEDAFNQKLDELRNFYQDGSQAAMQNARQDYRDDLVFTVGSGALAALLGALIGIWTMRRMARSHDRIEQQMAALETSRASLEVEATHDPLTGLANRRLFYDRLQQAIRHAKRYGSQIGILFVDMDRFKEINDRNGHHVGDAVLTEVAARIVNSVRESDTVARLGGDEFAVLLENVRGRSDCLSAAQKIEESLGAEASFYGLGVELAASIGQSMYPEDGQDEDVLLRAADAAMYKVKHGEATRRQRALFGTE
ncbi:MAG: diguanylate cyclase domain-containing protein [Thiobacillaceae bacterium]